MPYRVVWSGSIEMLGVYLATAKKHSVIPWDAGLTRLVNYTKNIAFRTDLQREWFMGGVELEFGTTTAITANNDIRSYICTCTYISTIFIPYSRCQHQTGYSK